MAWAETYLHAKWHLDPSSSLATINTAENWGMVRWGPSSPLLSERGAGSPSNAMSLGLRPTSLPSGILIHPSIWPQQICVAGSQSNTMWPGPRPTGMPSFILIHPTVWPQYTNVTDKTDRTDNSLWPWPRSTSVLRGILIYPAIWRQQTWANFFLGGGAGSPSNTMWPGPSLPLCHVSF